MGGVFRAGARTRSRAGKGGRGSLAIATLVGTGAVAFLMAGGSITGASSTGLTSGTATSLSFGSQPSNSSAFEDFTFSVNVLDQNGDTDTSDSGRDITIGLNGGPSGADLNCAENPVEDTGGSAAFECSINDQGTYTLTASSPGLTSATSDSFTIGAEQKPSYYLEFVAQPPASTQEGTDFDFGVEEINAANGTVNYASFNTSVTVAIAANPGGPESYLTCGGNPVNLTLGNADFSCAINVPGNDYTIEATSSDGATPAVSDPFDITAPGTNTYHLVFTEEPPSSNPAGGDMQFEVAEVNQDGQVDSNDYSTYLQAAIGNNPGDGQLSCPANPVPVTAGEALFDCAISTTGNGYTIVVSGYNANVGSVTSTPIDITSGGSSSGGGGGSGGGSPAPTPSGNLHVGENTGANPGFNGAHSVTTVSTSKLRAA